MAKVRFGPGGMSLSGGTGSGVFRTVNGETILQKKPSRRKKKAKATPKQKARRSLTRRAGKYGRHATSIPELRRIYEAIAKAEDNQVGSMANRDAFRAPIIDEIDASAYGGEPGDEIAIAAYDDTGVVRVNIRMTDEDGRLIERGDAEQDANGWWIYAAQTTVPEGAFIQVEATAFDRPGGKGIAGAGILVERSVGDPLARRKIAYGGGHAALWNDGSSEVDADPTLPGAEAEPTDVDAAAYPVPPEDSSTLDPGRLLQVARSCAGLSQRELARRSGMSQSVVSRIEKGQSSPTVATLLRLLHTAGFEFVGGLVVRQT